MNWYVIYTKPRQEQRALENLARQGFHCYLPTLVIEKVRHGKLDLVNEPMFPRYLFIALDDSGSGPSWSPIRSTQGVSHLVTFGLTPAKAPSPFIAAVRELEVAVAHCPQRLFTFGDQVQLTQGPLAGVEGIYQKIARTRDGETRAMILVELLHRPTAIEVETQFLKKAS